MFHDQRPSTSHGLESNRDDQHIRDIHALIPPHPPPSNASARRTETWETSSDGGASTENFTTMSREFSALVLAGSAAGNQNSGHADNENTGNNLARIGEDQEMAEETNPFAVVPDSNYPLALDPVASPGRRQGGYVEARSLLGGDQGGEVCVQRVKKEEVETKISAWQNAKIAKINNRFKREDAVINGWEGEQVLKATSWMKKVERKLEEKRARALEKMQNDAAKARRKAEDRRASAEAKRGTKVARILEITNLMRTVGRPPVKRSFF